MNFTVGYIYRTRDDQDVRIVATDAKGERPICGLLDYDSLGMEGALMWHSDGSYNTQMNDLDLVAQITVDLEPIPVVPPPPPPIWDWSATSPWFNFLFKYPSGKWSLSKTRPVLNGQGWTVPMPYPIPEQFYPQIQVPWNESLMERP